MRRRPYNAARRQLTLVYRPVGSRSAAASAGGSTSSSMSSETVSAIGSALQAKIISRPPVDEEADFAELPPTCALRFHNCAQVNTCSINLRLFMKCLTFATAADV